VTLYYRHPACFEHETGTHPENAARLRAIEAALDRRQWRGLDVREAPRATTEQLERAHSARHVREIEEFSLAGGGLIDLDTVLSQGSWEAALRAAGGACAAVDRLLAGDAGAAFCGMRPPGHHAERAKAMGFCLFNNAAVAAEHARAAGVERVFILDWDVHHGNGTEAIFRDRADVLYASIHEWPLYPGTGPAGFQGEGEGEGYTINMPVPSGTGEDVFLALLAHVVAPVVRSYRPGLVIISAGYDAHRSDPLGSLRLETTSYELMAAHMAAVAEEVAAPLLVCLEGGYDHDALADSVAATLDGIAAPRAAEGVPDEPARPFRERLHPRWLG
jgi:acetoin utilization deacetylase AcuC-like enzyme